MVLILSSTTDLATDYTVEWLNFYGIKFLRLNEEDLANTKVDILLDREEIAIKFLFNGAPIDLSEISGIWFRRGFLNFKSSLTTISDKEDTINSWALAMIERENITLLEFIVYHLKTKQSLNSQINYGYNKLLALAFARKAGLSIPRTVISSSGEFVRRNLTEPEFITKPIQDASPISINGITQGPGIASVNPTSLSSESFYCSLFQHKVKKKYELRIFFLGLNLYCSAIFSKGSIGLDIISNEKLVRIVPYKLPDETKSKLLNFIIETGLESGSIDMIVTDDHKHYFLEVNPVGQFGFIGKACNYNLYKEISNYFSDV